MHTLHACNYAEVVLIRKKYINTHRTGATGAAGALQDPAGLVLLPRGLEMPTCSRAGAGADAAVRAHAGAGAMSGHRVAVLVDAVSRLAVLHLAQVLILIISEIWYVVFLTSSVSLQLVVVEAGAARGAIYKPFAARG